MIVYDNCTPGSIVHWHTVNGPVSGLVIENDENGCLVRLPSGKSVILSTYKAIRHQAETQKNKTFYKSSN